MNITDQSLWNQNDCRTWTTDFDPQWAIAKPSCNLRSCLRCNAEEPAGKQEDPGALCAPSAQCLPDVPSPLDEAVPEPEGLLQDSSSDGGPGLSRQPTSRRSFGQAAKKRDTEAEREAATRYRERLNRRSYRPDVTVLDFMFTFGKFKRVSVGGCMKFRQGRKHLEWMMLNFKEMKPAMFGALKRQWEAWERSGHWTVSQESYSDPVAVMTFRIKNPRIL